MAKRVTNHTVAITLKMYQLIKAISESETENGLRYVSVTEVLSRTIEAGIPIAFLSYIKRKEDEKTIEDKEND